MSRRNRATKREILPDSKYNNLVVAKAINTVMWDGKKEVAENIVYSALEKLKKVAKDQNELAAFLEVVDVLKPVVEVRSRRVGGATYQVPVEVRKERQQTLALRWLVEYSRKRSERSREERLFAEMRMLEAGRGHTKQGDTLIKWQITKLLSFVMVKQDGNYGRRKTAPYICTHYWHYGHIDAGKPQYPSAFFYTVNL